MRRYQKKQLLEKFSILYEAHACVGELLSNRQSITAMLADCQGVAIEIGTEIEKYEDAESTPIRLLEDYCEIVYRISERRFPVDPAQLAASTVAELDQKLRLAETSLKEDVEEQLIVVFFPYKASMWDSMETVWKKLQQDENVSCIVVPLPYYIKDQNKKKVKKCYEGKEFPSDVPIINCEQFLKKGEYADIAIYHNPYDDTNKVTETDSRFFSSKLHQFADTLVYIPYYVLIDKPQTSFVLTPGVKNADYVILQDKDMVEEFQKWYPKQKDKFLPLGSPKINKAVEMNQVSREELDIPQQWKDRIRGKKVLFYNTHLVNFLDENIDFIGKLQSVFEFMKEQDDIVLWWRPHPLSDEMGYNTEPERFLRYKELIDWYKREDIGIYDDTPKLHEAIAASDAYYGNQSSLVKLFQAVGKPVMLQKDWYNKMRVLGSGDKLRKRKEGYTTLYVSGFNYYEYCHAMCMERNKLWYVSYYNALFFTDIETGRTQFVNYLPMTEPNEYLVYIKIISYQKKLYLIPYRTRYLLEYDISKDKFTSYDMGENVEGCYAAQLYDDKIFLLLISNVPTVLCYEIHSHQVFEVEEIKKVFEKYKCPTTWTADSCCLVNNKLYFIIALTNYLVEYDIQNKNVNVFELKSNCQFFTATAYHEGIFSISFDKSRGIYFDIKEQTILEFQFDEFFGGKSDGLYGSLFVWNDEIYFAPITENKMIVFDIDTGRVREKNIFSLDDNEIHGEYTVINDYIYKHPLLADKTIKRSDGKCYKIEDNTQLLYVFAKAMKCDFMEENGDFTFDLYIKMLLDR